MMYADGKFSSLASRLCVAGVLALAVSCSSAPKVPTEVNDRKNEAAGYMKLADGFLGKGQYASALQYYNEALETNLMVDNVEGAISSRSSLGRVYLMMKSYEDAEREIRDSLQDARALGNDPLIALCLSNFGELQYARGNAAEAEKSFVEAESKAGDRDQLKAVILHNRAVAAVSRNEPELAVTLLTTAMQANEKAKRWSEYAANSYVMASIKNKAGDTAGALGWAEKALEADKKAENSFGIAADLEALGKLNRKLSKNAEALAYFRRAFNLTLLINDAAAVERILVNMVELSTLLEMPDYAKRYTALLEQLKAK